MVSLASLWLPILLSSIAVFVVSSIIHMASPWHKGDYPRIPREDEVRAALRPLAIPPGGYIKFLSRFVDFMGAYVLHCHILGHEDRGMMQLVQVISNTTSLGHK